MSHTLSVIFYVVLAKSNMSLPQGCGNISNFFEMGIFSVSLS